MKKIYLLIISLTLALNILFPWMVYKLFGFFYVYYPVKEASVDRATLMLCVSLLLLTFILLLSKYGKKKLNYNIFEESDLVGKEIIHIYYIAIVVNLLNAISLGNFSSLINGASNGTIFSYLQLFLDMRILYFFSLLRAYKLQSLKKISLYSFLYVGISILYASRSGIFWMVFFNIILFIGLDIPKKLKKNIRHLLIIPILLAPFLFVFSTNARGDTPNTVEYFAKLIVARLSYTEASGIELEQYENATYDKEIFEEKYGLRNQYEQTINMIFPGDVFEYDVQPNQYWRAIFADWTVEGAKQHYTSMYMILPIYLCLKYGEIFGIAIFIFLIYILFRITCNIKESPVALFLSSYFFYTLVQYFDWAYHMRDLMCFLLTIFLIKIYVKYKRRVRFR